MKNVNMTLCVMVTILFMVATPGFSVTEFKDGATHDISSTINDYVWVDREAPGVQTTVNIRNGGSVERMVGLGDSRINVFDGTAGYSLYGDDNCQATMYGGTVDYFVAEGSSHISMSGGTVNKSIYAYDDSQLTMSDGSVEDGYLFVYHNCQATMSGGTVAGFIEVGNSATLVIQGSNFAIDGIPVGLGEIRSLGGSFINTDNPVNGYNPDPVRVLTGTLANGDIINNGFQIGDTSRIVLVPEPATLSMLAIGGVALLRRRRAGC